MKTNKEEILVGLFIALWIFVTIFFGLLMIGG
jgi:ABC-type transporter Mla subunit MlaD